MVLLDLQPNLLPYAVIEDNNTVIYVRKGYTGEMLLNVIRYKGSTGAIKLTWGVTIQPNTSLSFQVKPKSGQLEFGEGQWNSSIYLDFPIIPTTHQQIDVFVKLLNVSGGAMLGSFTTVKITFPPNVTESEVTNPAGNSIKHILTFALSCLGGAVLIGAILTALICFCKSRKR